MRRILQVIFFTAALLLGSTASQVFAQTTSPTTYYWVGNSGSWQVSANWSTTSATSGVINPLSTTLPGSSDNVVFDAGSFNPSLFGVLSTQPVVTINNNVTVGSIQISGIPSGLTVTLQGAANLTLTVNGTYTVNGSVTNQFLGRTIFAATGDISTNVPFSGPVDITGVRTLIAPLTVNNNITISNTGNLTANSNISLTGNWSSAGTFTQANNTVVTFNGTSASTINTSSTSSFKDLTINKTNATVSLTSPITVSSKLTVSSGTLSDGGNLLTVSNGATLNLSNGTTLNLATATTALPANNNVILNSGSTVVYSSNSAQTIRGGITYGNLEFTNTLSGTSTVTKTLGAATAVAANITVSGNLTIGDRNIITDAGFLITGNNTGTMQMNGISQLILTNTPASGSPMPVFNSYNLAATSTVEYAADADQNVRGISSGTLPSVSGYGNLIISRSGSGTTQRTKTLTGLTTIQGNLEIKTYNTLATNNSAVNIQGNLSTDITIPGADKKAPSTPGGTFSTGTSTITLYGTNTITQLISGDPYTFQNLIINKNAKANTVTLNTKVAINGQGTFTLGIVNTTTVYPMDSKDDPIPASFPTSASPGLLIFNDNATVGGVSHNSHVNGYVRKEGNDSFEFPIGNGVYYRPAGIVFKDNGMFTYDARYINRQSTGDTRYNYRTGARPVQSVSKYEYWHIVSVVPNSSPNVWLSWEMPISGGFEDPNYISANNLWMLTVAAWSGSAWGDREKANVQILDSNPATFRGRFEAGSATNSNTHLFSIGSIFNALPIDLLYVRATAAENTVQVDWATAGEINNDYFTVERSVDGKNFTEVTTVNGKGNSKEVNKYNAVDYAPYSGVSYYRLKQTDFDGKFTYSKTVAVELSSIANSLQAYSTGSKALQLNYRVSGEEQGVLTIHDSRGVQVWSKMVSGTTAEIREEISLSSAASGIYIISLQTPGGKIVKKVMTF